MKIFKTVIVLSLVALSAHSSFGQQRNIALHDIITEMKLNQKGRFPYGFKPNTPREKVEEQMKGHADVFQKDSLFVTFSIYLNEEDTDFGDISFDFPKGKLTSASIETYLGSWEVANKSFNAIKANFDRMYGPAEFKEDTFYWKYKKKGKIFEIQLWEVDYEGDNGYGIDFLYYDAK